MNAHEQSLVESIKFWQQSANFDKRQLKLSLGMLGTGLLLAGVGIREMLTGDVVGGAAEVATGLVVTSTSYSTIMGEVQDYGDSRAKIAIRQQYLEEHLDSQETDSLDQ